MNFILIGLTMKDFDLTVLKRWAAEFHTAPLKQNFLDERYNWQKDNNGAEWPYYRFFYHLARKLQPGLIVELGTYQGTAAAHFAAAMVRTPGVIITVDHHTDPGDDDNQLKVLEAQDLYPNILYYRGWTTPHLAEVQKGLHALGDVGDVYQRIKDFTNYYRQGIDILFIDSWHCYEYAKMDFEIYRPLLGSPALVICDDIIGGGGPQDPIRGMLEFWNELPEPKFLNANLHPNSNMGFVKYESL